MATNNITTVPQNVNTPLLSSPTKSPVKAGPPTVALTGPQSPDPATTASKPSTAMSPTTPAAAPARAETNKSWGTPLGLGVRGANDENLIIFRRALGINWTKQNADGATLEEGRKTATGIYKTVLQLKSKKQLQNASMTALLYVLYFAQVVIGAALTSLGPTAEKYKLAITLLGAINTIIAGVLALIKGTGQPQRLGKDYMEYRRLQDWIEETEALLAVGVIGRNRQDVGMLVEVAFKKYNAAKMSEENNQPDVYVRQPLESLGNKVSSDGSDKGMSARKVGS